MYGSAAGLTDEHFRLLEERGTPQPYATFTTPLRLSDDGSPGVRRAVIFCSDGGMSLAMLRDLVNEGDPRAAVFADPGWELHELETGHWAMLAAPGLTAELLHEIASAR